MPSLILAAGGFGVMYQLFQSEFKYIDQKIYKGKYNDTMEQIVTIALLACGLFPTIRDSLPFLATDRALAMDMALGGFILAMLLSWKSLTKKIKTDNNQNSNGVHNADNTNRKDSAKKKKNK
jgi:hypothetical protein